MDAENHFKSPQEEIGYWKHLAEEYKQKFEDVKDEFDEFQLSSQELENELEKQLEQHERQNDELQSTRHRLQRELEALRDKYEQQHTSSNKQLSEVQDKLAQETAHRQELQNFVRKLEQSNDDLERSNRALVVSLEDFEARLSQAIERNAVLESELEDKEGLIVTVQRLKDEARDLRQEVSVRQKKPVSEAHEDKPAPQELPHKCLTMTVQMEDSNKLIEQVDRSNSYIGLPNGSTNSNLPPSVRISALNIVGDLLRRVGAIESKLASCRSANTTPNGNPTGIKNGPTSPVNSPRAKRQHRGLTAPTSSSSQPAIAFTKVAI